MKNKFLIIAFLVLVSGFGFSQEKEDKGLIEDRMS